MNLNEYFTRYDLTESQKEAVDRIQNFLTSRKSNVFLLKGYAGTGKTFITKGLTEFFKLDEIKRNFTLSAPTGKAAKVIAKKTCQEARTIHATIYSTNNIKEYKKELQDKTFKFYFSLNVNSDAVDTVYIFDEASMISDIYSEMEFITFGSGYLLTDLMKYVNFDVNDYRKKIIFIGDNAQLPPVNMQYSPALSEKYLSKKFNVAVDSYELKNVVRQKEGSGVLANTMPLRSAIEKKVFNKLSIDTSYNDVNHVDHQKFMQEYLSACGNNIDPQTMIIAYSNSSVHDYNDRIREHFFPGHKDEICVNDRIICTSNNYQTYCIPISNGDFGTILQVGQRETRRIVPRGNWLDVTLFFRDVIALFIDEFGNSVPIQCKIIENLLYSKEPTMSSDETKALYVDFMMRNPNLKPNTEEWKWTLISDPYFNALRVKFGYAITCHKAQGSEWERVFINCESYQKKQSENYFRWLYTALTRAKTTLFTINEPQFGIFSNLKLQGAYKVVTPPKIVPAQMPSANLEPIQPKTQEEFIFENQLQSQIYAFVASKLAVAGVKIVAIFHNEYCEKYTLESDQENCVANIYYNSKNTITNIDIKGNNLLIRLVRMSLAGLEKHTFVCQSEFPKEFQFENDVLREFYEETKSTLEQYNIKIINIEHLSYRERYFLVKETLTCEVDFCYDSKGIFTSYTARGDEELKSLVLTNLGN